MDVLRTPKDRFRDLADFPFDPRYVDVGGLRMHYVDEGPRDGAVVLMLHGEPTWSYLYRHMIPVFVDSGFRAVAPDLIGFGRSDKPSRIADYSYAGHVNWVRSFIESVDLGGMTLVCQDWGSLIGLRLAVEIEERFDRVVVANGYLPTGDENLPGVFRLWRTFARWTPWFPIGRIVDSGCAKTLSRAVRAGYDAPYPSAQYKAGARAFPRLVPTRPDAPGAADNRAAWKKWERWEKPLLTAFGSRDPIFRGADKVLQDRIPGAKGQPHAIVHGAGHFIQEDKGPELAGITVDFMRSTS